MTEPGRREDDKGIVGQPDLQIILTLTQEEEGLKLSDEASYLPGARNPHPGNKRRLLQ